MLPSFFSSGDTDFTGMVTLSVDRIMIVEGITSALNSSSIARNGTDGSLLCPLILSEKSHEASSNRLKRFFPFHCMVFPQKISPDFKMAIFTLQESTLLAYALAQSVFGWVRSRSRVTIFSEGEVFLHSEVFGVPVCLQVIFPSVVQFSDTIQSLQLKALFQVQSQGLLFGLSPHEDEVDEVLDVELHPEVDVELPPEVDVELPPEVDVELPPEVDVELPPEVDVELPPEEELDDPHGIGHSST